MIGKVVWYLRDAVDERDGQLPFPRVELEMTERRERDEVRVDVGYNVLAQSGDGAWSILPVVPIMTGTESGIGRGSEGVSRGYDCLYKSCGGFDGCSSGVFCTWWISGSGATRGGNYGQCQRRSLTMKEHYLIDWQPHCVQVKPH